MAVEVLYVDASVLFRRLLGRRLPRPLGDKALITSSELVAVDLARMIDRAQFTRALDKLAAGQLRANLARVLDAIMLFPVSDQVLRLAVSPFPIALASIEALHVATAQVVASDAERLTFWTYDPLQAAAAVTRGLVVHAAPDA